MREAYCLTALEAAEMAGIELDEVMRRIAERPGVGLRVGDAWRVDPAMLAMAAEPAGLRAAA